MRQSKIDKFIFDYCQKYSIKLLINPKLDKDDGLCYPQCREIHLSSKYSSNKIKLAVFCHEAAHIRVERFKNKPYNIFECELRSWMEAIHIYNKFFKKSFSKSQAEFMIKCLKSYCRSQYEFKKIKTENN